jgi:hypothetical protein
VSTQHKSSKGPKLRCASRQQGYWSCWAALLRLTSHTLEYGPTSCIGYGERTVPELVRQLGAIANEESVVTVIRSEHRRVDSGLVSRVIPQRGFV